ncbi:MAG: response regulator transcription factor [Clostridia bacterium]|nr:response regulator transcription factor [Clostridia bacterium]
MRILLVEDDQTIVQTLSEFLESEGFSIVSTDAEEKATAAMSIAPFDLCLLDVSLANGNGFGVCKNAKERGVPVIFLTASSDENSVVKGLDMGADDYITKPFRPRELVSRIRSVLRRSGAESVLLLGNGVTVDPDRGVVTKDGGEIKLSALEFRLLMAFLNHRGKLMTREKLLEDIWDIAGDFVNDNTLTVYIKRLRVKLGDDPQDPQIIKTVRGIGYRMD